MTRDYFENISTSGRIILKWALKRYNKKVWIRKLWLTVWKRGRPCEHDDNLQIP
jgi:hypothetical protein